jgi:hypothetical protein
VDGSAFTGALWRNLRAPDSELEIMIRRAARAVPPRARRTKLLTAVRKQGRPSPLSAQSLKAGLENSCRKRDLGFGAISSFEQRQLSTAKSSLPILHVVAIGG